MWADPAIGPLPIIFPHETTDEALPRATADALASMYDAAGTSATMAFLRKVSAEALPRPSTPPTTNKDALPKLPPTSSLLLLMLKRPCAGTSTFADWMWNGVFDASAFPSMAAYGSPQRWSRASSGHAEEWEGAAWKASTLFATTSWPTPRAVTLAMLSAGWQEEAAAPARVMLLPETVTLALPPARTSTPKATAGEVRLAATHAVLLQTDTLPAAASRRGTNHCARNMALADWEGVLLLATDSTLPSMTRDDAAIVALPLLGKLTKAAFALSCGAANVFLQIDSTEP